MKLGVPRSVGPEADEGWGRGRWEETEFACVWGLVTRAEPWEPDPVEPPGVDLVTQQLKLHVESLPDLKAGSPRS